ncbi:DUF3108 domain-containing protein [Pontibacter sp. JAM-7]|uniref:DUF3108 domain-containing protein n=1 Tax=Pontibacter sp. JAM-7 TaxID=3366581 RepID=UPI003AF8B24F
MDVMRRILLLPLLAVVCNLPLSLSAAPLPAVLQPFVADYTIDWNGGLAMSGTTMRSLKQQTATTWQFKSSATSLLAGIEETTQVEWHKQRIRPLNYQYRRSVLGKKRKVDISFDWAKQEATNTVKNKPWKMPVSDQVQDKLSYQLLLQQLLAEGKTEFEFDVADGGHLKQYRFAVNGEEIITAPIGKFNAVRVDRIHDEDSDRKTLIWFAPELNYQIIKLHHVEDKGKEYTLLLQKLVTDNPP